MLQEESIASLIDTISNRETQIRQLAAIFCQPNFLSPPTTVVYGVKSTGKTLTINSILQSSNTRYATVQSADWVDSRQLLEAIVLAVANISTKEGEKNNKEGDQVVADNIIGRRCENISSFVIHLQLLLEGKGKTILVLDGIDRQREPWLTLLPAIARLGEVVCLKIIFIIIFFSLL